MWRVTDSFENLMDDNAPSHVTPSFCLQSRGSWGYNQDSGKLSLEDLSLCLPKSAFFFSIYFLKFEQGKGNGFIESSGYLGIYLLRVGPLCYLALPKFPLPGQ